MKAVLTLLGWLVVAVTIMPLSRFGLWWIRIFDFPRAHIAVAAALTAMLLPLAETPPTFADWILLFALAASVIIQAYWIYPYTMLVAPEVQNSRHSAGEVRLMIANILVTNRQFPRLANYVAQYDPDMLLVLETNEWWARQLQSLDPRFPHKVSYPLENAYGISLHSKLDLVDTEIRFLVQDDIPSIRTKVKLNERCLVEFYGVHPRPPTPPEHDRSTERDAELILIGRECEMSKLPVIVAGDLNDVAWSYGTLRFRKISRHARSAHRARFLRHLSRQAAVFSVAAGSCVSFGSLSPRGHEGPAAVRFGSPARFCPSELRAGCRVHPE